MPARPVRLTHYYLAGAAIALVVACAFNDSQAEAAREAYARGGFNPNLQRGPEDCRLAGLQWVAMRADGGEWTHVCLRIVLEPHGTR